MSDDAPLSFEEIEEMHASEWAEAQSRIAHLEEMLLAAQDKLQRLEPGVEAVLAENIRLDAIHKRLTKAFASAQYAGKLIQSTVVEEVMKDANYEWPRPDYQHASEPSYAERRRLQHYWYDRCMRLMQEHS